MATVTKAYLIVMGLALAWAYPPELGGDGEDLDDHRPYRGFSSYRGFNSYREKTDKDVDNHKPYRGFSSYRGLNSYRTKTDSKVPPPPTCKIQPAISCGDGGGSCQKQCDESNCGCTRSYCDINQPEEVCVHCGEFLCDDVVESEPECLDTGAVCKTNGDCCSDLCGYTNTDSGFCVMKSKPPSTTLPEIPASCKERPSISCEDCNKCERIDCGCTSSYCARTVTSPDKRVCVQCYDWTKANCNTLDKGESPNAPERGLTKFSEPSKSEVSIQKTPMEKCDAIENTEVSSISCQTDEDCLPNCESECPCLPLCCPCCRCNCRATYCEKNTCVFCTTCSDDNTNSTKKGESPNAPERGLTKLSEPSLEPSQGQQFPICAQIDAPCTSDDTCCSKNCEYFVPPGCHLSGTAGHPVPNQETNGDPATNCNVTKFEHVCRPSIDCIEENEQCLKDEDCCDESLCIPKKAVIGPVSVCVKAPGKECIPGNEECKAGDDCCDEGFQCIPTNNRMNCPNGGANCGNLSLCIEQQPPGKECIPENEQCLEDEDCCDESLCIPKKTGVFPPVSMCVKAPGKECIPGNEECKAGDDCCDEGFQCIPTNNKMNCPNGGANCGNLSLCIEQQPPGKECTPENELCREDEDCCDEGAKCKLTNNKMNCLNGASGVGCVIVSVCVKAPGKDCIPENDECEADEDCCDEGAQCIPTNNKMNCPNGASGVGCGNLSKCKIPTNEIAPRSLSTTGEEAGAPSTAEQTLNKLFEAMMSRLQSGKSIKFKVDVKNPEAILGNEDNSARRYY